MALQKLTSYEERAASGFFAYEGLRSGHIGGDQFFKEPTRVVWQAFRHPASPTGRRSYQAERDFQNAIDQWPLLTIAQRTAWDDFAAGELLWNRSGRPRLVSGEEYFITWNTNNAFYSPLEPFAYDPPTPPIWWPQRPAFEEFMTVESGQITLTAETEFPAGCRIAAYASMPKPGLPRLQEFSERYAGTITFAGGLSVGETTTAFSTLYEGQWLAPALDTNENTWLRLYEVERGYLRPLKDPCSGGRWKMVIGLRNDDLTANIIASTFQLTSNRCAWTHTIAGGAIPPGGTLLVQWNEQGVCKRTGWSVTVGWTWEGPTHDSVTEANAPSERIYSSNVPHY